MKNGGRESKLTKSSKRVEGADKAPQINAMTHDTELLDDVTFFGQKVTNQPKMVPSI